MSRRFNTKKCVLIVLLIFLIFRKLNRKVQYVNIERFIPDMKNILLWTDISGIEGAGQRKFVEKRCQFYNCFITKNRTLYGDERYFDAVLFNSRDVSQGSDIPEVRASLQKYIFVASDSDDNHPICDPIYDNYFNWTWTYRYDSTISYRFFTIFNAQYEELGSHFEWYDNMEPVDNTVKFQFATKSKAAAVFLDHCKTRSYREALISELQMNLVKYNLTVDVYGKCGPLKCKRKTMSPCLWRLKKTYYFYLAFEDSIAYDYVTDLVLYGYNNNAVPIVYGGAKYERYLPPGSYINAGNMSSKVLADTIYSLMKNKEDYYDYFRYKRYYFFSKVEPLNICKLCEVLNSPARLIQPEKYYNFRKWWNPNYLLQCFDGKNLFL